MAEHKQLHWMPSRRQVLTGAAALGGFATMSFFVDVEARSNRMAKVNLQLGWLASNGIMGEIVAKRMGFYDEEGIELEVTPGGPSVDGLASVAAGRAQSGQLSSSPSLMLARSAGIPVKAFAAGFQKHPFTYFSLKSNPIRAPRDMIGKTIATQPTAMILLKALLAKHRIAEDQVEIVEMESDMNQLMTGRSDAVTGWLSDVTALEIIGDDRVDMMLWGRRYPALCQRLLHDRRHPGKLRRRTEPLSDRIGPRMGRGSHASGSRGRPPRGRVRELEPRERAQRSRSGPRVLLQRRNGNGRLGNHESCELAGSDRHLRRARAVPGTGTDSRRRDDHRYPCRHGNRKEAGLDGRLLLLCRPLGGRLSGNQRRIIPTGGAARPRPSSNGNLEPWISSLHRPYG